MKSNSMICSLAAFSLLTVAAMAQTPVETPAAPALVPPEASVAQPAVPVDASSAVADTATADEAAKEEDLRDPFWPINYTPVGAVKPPPRVVPDNATQTPVIEDTPSTPAQAVWPEIKASAILKGPKGKYLASIRDMGVVEPGDIVVKDADNFRFRWQIESIDAKGVVFKRLDVKVLRR